MIDTFSTNSLKVLDKSKEEFEKKYIQRLDLIKDSEEAKLGNKFHGLICYYLKNYDIKKMEDSLSKEEKEIWEKTKSSQIIDYALKNKKYIEQPFFIKENLNGKDFYLTGRFDLVVVEGENCTIFDWKTRNIPKNPENDVQSLVYLHSAHKLFKKNEVKIVYYSLTENITTEAFYTQKCLEKIKEIISKLNG